MYCIDPGPKTSGVVIFDGMRIHEAHSKRANADVLKDVQTLSIDAIACEVIYPRGTGTPIGHSTMDTCFFSGLVAGVAMMSGIDRFIKVPRYMVVKALEGRKIKKAHGYSTMDSAVRRACIDRLGEQGTKASPGPTYGVSGHAWQALGVGITATGMQD